MTNISHILRKAKLEDALQSGLKENEYSQILNILGREISVLEVGIFAALYSEHCSYKSTKVHLKTLPTEGPEVIQGPGENAGIVDIGDGQGVAFKVESHNHPSYIEPFQGAATGVGGILRDVFTMNARPLALLNSLRFGDPKHPKTKYLLSRAVAGIGNYGNCVGVPTVGGELFFHESYNGNCLVNAFALGLVENDKIFRGRAAGIGNRVLYAGSKTGRDGIHGATMASEEFGESSEEKRPTVQVGDPFQEKLVLEACLEAMAAGAVVGIQDMGAAGLTSSSYEMAARAGTGLKLHLDRVPQREEGMNPYELMLSESQERMLLIVERGKEQPVLDIFRRWGLDAVEVGEVVEGSHVDLYWHGELISSLPHDVLVNNAPQYRWPESAPVDYQVKLEFKPTDIEPPADLAKVWLELLGSPNLCSRFSVYQQYDSTVRSNTVVHPGGDAALIRIKADQEGRPEKGIAITLDCNSRYCAIDPRLGAAHAIVEGVRNVTAVGARPIGLSDCLNFGSPEKPEGMWQIAEAIRGLNDSARALSVPIVSGNVSLYNETKGSAIYPTPLLATVGLIGDVKKAVGAHFVEKGDVIFLIGESFEELGGSEYLAHYAGVEKGALPVIDYQAEVKTAALIRDLIDRGLLRSCHDLSQGGLAIALAESCLGTYSSRGVLLRSEKDVRTRSGEVSQRKDALLFGESGARYLVSAVPNKESAIRSLAEQAGIAITMSGIVGGDNIEIEGYAKLNLKQAENAWKGGLKSLI